MIWNLKKQDSCASWSMVCVHTCVQGWVNLTNASYKPWALSRLRQSESGWGIVLVRLPFPGLRVLDSAWGSRGGYQHSLFRCLIIIWSGTFFPPWWTVLLNCEPEATSPSLSCFCKGLFHNSKERTLHGRDVFSSTTLCLTFGDRVFPCV